MTGAVFKAEKLKFTGVFEKGSVTRAEWHGGPFTVVKYSYKPGSEFPSHSHGPAQITIVFSGRIIFHAAGDNIELNAGDAIYIPSDAPHSASVPTDSEPVVSFNIFHPPRREHP